MKFWMVPRAWLVAGVIGFATLGVAIQPAHAGPVTKVVTKVAKVTAKGVKDVAKGTAKVGKAVFHVVKKA